MSMCVRATVAALVLTCALFAASCVRGSDDSPADELGEPHSSALAEPTGEAQQEARGARFTPGDFVFAIEREWDGKDKAGGWQIAFNTTTYASELNGAEVYQWQCRLRIGMPRHSEKAGAIPTDGAAKMSAEVMNAVTWPMLDRREPWTGQGGLFCIQQRELMQKVFDRRYPNVGARVQQG